MKKCIVLFISLILMFSLLTACGNKDLHVTENTNSNTTVEVTDTTITTTEAIEENIVNTYSEYWDFSEGLAWTKYSNKNGDFWGCINKNGQMLFEFSADEIIEVSSFSDGYAYIKQEDCIKIIDTNGVVCSNYPIDDNNNIVAYGDGFAFTENYQADFDSTLYTYKICNSKGDVIQSFTLTEKKHCNFKHYGKGVFGYYTSPWDWKIYFPSSDKWIDYKPGGNGTFYFKDSFALMGIDYGGGHDHSDGYRGKLQIIDLNGNIKEVTIPEDCGWNWSLNLTGIHMVSGISALHEFLGDYIISYNLENNTFAKMPETYAEKVLYDELPEPLIFEDGYISLPLKGSDGNKYVGLFDTNWKTAMEPVQISNDGYHPVSCERLIVKNVTETVVYDLSGQVVFTPSDNGYYTILPYADDVARVDGKAKPIYLDKNGNLLFEEIDMSQLK